MVRGFFHQPQLAGSCSEFCNHRNFFNADFNDSWDSRGFGTFQSPDALPDLDHEHPDFTHDRSTDHFGCGDVFFYSRIGIQGTHIAVILAHAALGTPFV